MLKSFFSDGFQRVSSSLADDEISIAIRLIDLRDNLKASALTSLSRNSNKFRMSNKLRSLIIELSFDKLSEFHFEIDEWEERKHEAQHDAVFYDK